MITRRNVIILTAPAIICLGSLMRIKPSRFHVRLPMIRQVLPELIADQIIGVQDMTSAREAFGELHQLLSPSAAFPHGRTLVIRHGR